MNWTAMIVLAAAMGVTAGCDRNSPPPASPRTPASGQASTAADSNLPKRPTTRQLEQMPRKRLKLGTLPLSIEVPPGWHIQSLRAGGQTMQMLTGFAPHSESEIQIQLLHMILPALEKHSPAEQLEFIVNGAMTEARENNNPNFIKTFSRRSLGQNVTVLEKQHTPRPGATTQYGDQGNPLPPIHIWSIRVLVPAENQLQGYELDFIGLSEAEFQADKDFLNHLLNTLRYEGAATRP